MIPGLRYAELDGEREVEAYFSQPHITWGAGKKGLVDPVDGLDGNWRTLIASGQTLTYRTKGMGRRGAPPGTAGLPASPAAS